MYGYNFYKTKIIKKKSKQVWCDGVAECFGEHRAAPELLRCRNYSPRALSLSTSPAPFMTLFRETRREKTKIKKTVEGKKEKEKCEYIKKKKKKNILIQ